MSKQWLKWVGELQAIAQNGLFYTENPFDVERYEALMKIATEMASFNSDAELETIEELFRRDSHYKTPNLDVRAAVFKDDKILLVQESNDLWTIPGGWCDVNTSPADNAVKEVHEETGLSVKVVKLIALYDKLKQDHPPQFPHAYKCFFLCEILGGELRTSIETQAVGFYGLDELPELCTNRISRAQIDRCYAHYEDPSLPAEFD